MAETAPRSNPRLEAFDNAKADQDRAQFENELYEGAGTTDFSQDDSVDYGAYMDYARNERRAGRVPSREAYAQMPENQRNARRRVEEADEYERHLQAMAERPNYDPSSAEGARERRTGFIDTMADLNDQPSPSHERALLEEDAYAENDRRNAEAEDSEFEARLASNPKLRRINNVSRELHDLGNKEVNPDTEADDSRRHDELTALLTRLIDEFEPADDYESAVAAGMIDRDSDLLRRYDAKSASSNPVETPSPAPAEAETLSDEEKDKLRADIAALEAFVASNPEVAERTGIADRLRDLRARLGEADDEGDLPPKIDEDTDDDEGDLPPKIDDDEKTDDDEGDLPPKIDEDTDDDEKTGDGDDADEGEAGDGEPDDNPTAELPPVADDNEAAPDRRRFSRLRDRLLKIGVIFQNGLHRSIDRLRSSNKKEVAAIVGGVAVIGALMVMWRTGVFHGGGGGNVHPADALPHGGGNTLPPSPTEVLPSTAPKLPGSEGYAYPWNWAHDAAPKGVNPETWLHELGDKAAAAGHAVEWHKGAGDVEWVSVDGNSNTRGVIDALLPFAQ